MKSSLGFGDHSSSPCVYSLNSLWSLPYFSWNHSSSKAVAHNSYCSGRLKLVFLIATVGSHLVLSSFMSHLTDLKDLNQVNRISSLKYK